MDQTNLAAAILRVTRQRLDHQHLDNEMLTDEKAIELAGWLQSEPSLNSWRQIYLNSNSVGAESVTRYKPRP